MKFQFEVRDDKRAATRIENMAERARDARPVMARVAVVLQIGVRETAESKGAHLSEMWPPLAESTRERKARQGLPEETLVATGALLASLEGHTAESIFRVNKQSAVVGTRDPKARYHHRGFSASFGKVGRHGVPRRKLVGIAKHDREHAIELIQNYLVRGQA